MKEIKLEYHNYKKPGSGELESNSNLVIVEGDNGVGKTSLINGILENLNAKAISEEPLKRGTSSGFKQVRVPDKNGEPITINHTFGTKEKPKFYATRDNGQNITSVTQIREIIGDVCPYTIEDVFRKNDSVQGRREIVKNIFLPLLSLDDQKRIETINNKINTTNGTLYIERRDKGKVIETLKGSKVSNEAEVTNYLNGKENVSRSMFDKHIESIQNQIKELENKLTALITESSNIDANIRMLSKWLSIANSVSEFKEEFPRNEYAPVLNEWFNSSINVSKFFEDSIKSLKDKDYSSSIEKEKENIETKRKELSNALIIQNHINSLANIDVKIKKHEDEYNNIEKELDNLKKEKSNIFSNSKLPNGLEILSDSEYTFNGFSINSAELSESEAWLLLLKLIMPIYSGKVLFAGNIGIYGKKALKEVYELAESYGKICLVEKVNDEIDDVVMMAYIDEENIDVSESNNDVPEEKQDYAKSFKEKVEKTKKGEDPFVPNKEAKPEEKEETHKDVNVNKPIEMDKPLFGDIDNTKSLF